MQVALEAPEQLTRPMSRHLQSFAAQKIFYTFGGRN